jgi:hypothetical protein
MTTETVETAAGAITSGIMNPQMTPPTDAKRAHASPTRTRVLVRRRSSAARAEEYATYRKAGDPKRPK